MNLLLLRFDNVFFEYFQVPESITANQMGIKVVGISCVTNMAAGVSETRLNHKEVVETAGLMTEIFK